MDPREWFDEGTYSDLAIRLSNGSEVKVHKVIVCRLNKYFRKLCGPESHFAESNQSTIELRDDDPAALTNVLRNIYDLPVDENFPSTPAWRFWLNLRITADKYLVPKLKDDADIEFRRVASASTDADEVFDILEAIAYEMAHEESFVELAEVIRKNNFGKLLQNERYRAKLDSGGKEVLWQVIDELAFVTHLKEKRYRLCDSHRSTVFQEPGHENSLAECSLCRGYSAYKREAPERAGWIDM